MLTQQHAMSNLLNLPLTFWGCFAIIIVLRPLHFCWVKQQNLDIINSLITHIQLWGT